MSPPGANKSLPAVGPVRAEVRSRTSILSFEKITRISKYVLGNRLAKSCQSITNFTAGRLFLRPPASIISDMCGIDYQL